MRTVTVAAAQPQTHRGADEIRNVDRALEYIDEAADAGAQIISFPEGYPGPYYGALDYCPDEEISNKARERSMFVIHSRLEETELEDKYALLLRLVDPNGNLRGTYQRVQVPSTRLNRLLFGKDLKPGSESDLAVYETEIGNIGLLICSEVYSPELSRILTLKGADMIFYPVGGLIYEMMASWKTMVRARAIENLIYVVSTGNIYGREQGMGTIVGPEEILAESAKPGLLVAELDLDRLDELRDDDEPGELPYPSETVPGLIRWRRPELYGTLLDA